jgi:single-strand DNA-binding protein
MPSYNKIIVMGNLVRDPETQTLASGTTACKFTVAATHTYLDANKQKKEEVCFIDVNAFSKTAENIAKFFSKGKPILVEGRLKLETWDDKNTGKKCSKHIIVLDSFQFIGNKDDAARETTQKEPSRPQQDAFEDGDDVPF